jgi:hypothetical protein
MILYDAFLAGEDVYEKLLNDEIRKHNYLNRCKAIAESTWVAKSLRNLAGSDPYTRPVVEEFINTLAEKLKTMIGIFAAPGRKYADIKESTKAGIRSILQKLLNRSDKCLLEVMILTYQKDALNSDNLRKLTELWFPSPPPKPGGKQRGGSELLPQAESLEAVLAQPDPKLTDDLTPSTSESFPSIDEGLKLLEGGTHKGNKTRRNRVKMSRRK